MKILCVSDSHLDNETLKNITSKYKEMDLYVHCGDSDIEADNPLLEKYYVVKGNHDHGEFEDVIVVKKDNINIMLTHGHLFGIYEGYEKIINFMNEKDVQICFHGHTHIPAITNINNKLIINPGSTMFNRATYEFGTYAIISIDDNIDIKYYHHKNHHECTNKVLEDGIVMLEKIKEAYRNKNK